MNETTRLGIASGRVTNGGPVLRDRPFHHRAQAARRLPPLPCGHADPWSADHRRPDPTDQSVDGYLLAIEHLQALGLTPAPLLPEMRLAWQRGGKDRRTAQLVAQRWETAA